MAPIALEKALRHYTLGAWVAWIMATSTIITLKLVSEQYVFHSQVFFLTVISANLVLLGAIGYTWMQLQTSIKRLEIESNTKFGIAKQVIYMSLKTIYLSGTGIIVQLGLQQAEGIAQPISCVNLVMMLLGPLLFVLFVCNNTTVLLVTNHVLAWWNLDIICALLLSGTS